MANRPNTCMKRLTKERERLPDNCSDFFVNWKDADMQNFDAFVLGPEDSLYRHKFVKLKFSIPDEYPLVPPKVTFLQHTGNRIHPNLYVDGKVCLSILGTWAGEPWSYSMTIESVLITIRSLLDNSPYKHEPHQHDNPAFNTYVRYNTWRWLLLDYLDREQDAEAQDFLRQYLCKHGSEMIGELERQKAIYGSIDGLHSPYKRNETQKCDYQTLLSDLRRHVSQSRQSTSDLAIRGQTLRNYEQKRKAQDDLQDDQPPKQKQKQEIIDLT